VWPVLGQHPIICVEGLGKTKKLRIADVSVGIDTRSLFHHGSRVGR
jgi:hypothetical protein